MTTFEGGPHDIIRLQPLIPHVGPLVSLALSSEEISSIAQQVAPLLALLSAQPVFVPEYKAFVIPGGI